jgi:hypothetical protein
LAVATTRTRIFDSILRKGLDLLRADGDISARNTKDFEIVDGEARRFGGEQLDPERSDPAGFRQILE